MKTAITILSLFICFSLHAQTAKSKTTTKTAKTKTSYPKIPKDADEWVIDAQKAKCEGAVTSMCLLVKKSTEKDFNLFYDHIEGFDYQEGFVYTIWVEMGALAPKIPTDGSPVNYKLLRVVSKKPVEGYSNTNVVDNKKPLSSMNVSITKTLIVNEEQAQCEGNPDAKCLLIKEEGKKEFEVFYQGIEGFTFIEGYRQTILVSERHIANPMIKEAEPIYTLISVVKKEFIFDAKKLSALPVEPPKTPLDKKWVLRKIQETDTSSFIMDDDGLWLEFNSAANKVTGKAPCNSFFGGFNSDFISSIQVMAIGNTRMYCENMKYEELYLSYLQNAERFEIKEGKLYLFKGKRLLLIFD